MRVTHGLVSIASWPKAIAVSVEVGVPLALDDLRQRLLDESVRHCRDAEQALSSVWLGDFYALDWFGLVSACHQLRADAGPVRFEVGAEFIDAHAINARCTFIANDPRQGCFEVLFAQNLCHQG